MTNNAAPGAPPSPLPAIVNQFRSPNFHPGRGDQAIALFVEHNTESTGAGNAPSLAWFRDPASGVSIHHLIARDGTRFDLVRRADTAYHTGEAAYNGRYGDVYHFPDGTRVALANVVSLGCEFESSATIENPGNGYTDAQLWTGAYTRACTVVSYGAIPCVMHAEIAQPPGRRHDPSWFPWDVYLPRVEAWIAWLRALPPAELPRWCL